MLMRFRLILSVVASLAVASASAQDLNYFLPDSVKYDPSVPKPKDIIHHEVGEYHVTHDRLVNYMEALARAVPSRVKLERMGFTYEKRPQVLLIITSPKNHGRLEEIRQRHLQLSDPSKSASVDIRDMPVVVWIGHSIHGNEQSGTNASLVSAYYLAAAQGKEIDELLENTIILFDPSFNPDGMQRFSTWVNQHRGKNLVSDPNSREFNEVWPGGRYNHYWFDLNRDWLPAVHVESQNRLEWYHRWKPNVLTDHHEQGSNATFFFQPGVPSRVNPLTPAKNQELTAKLGEYHARYLDRIGSLYFTKENYDDFYYGKGSTYPDINGAVGILFEQASSRGHLQQTSNGLLSFPFTIRNQFVTTLSTLRGAKELRTELLEWQREFYKTAMQESASNPVKGYVFGNTNDEAVLSELLTMLRRHEIDVRQFRNTVNVKGTKYAPSNSYIVSLNQPQSRLIQTIFSRVREFRDSLFYDITSWTIPLAFGMDVDELNASQLRDASIGEAAGTRARYQALATMSSIAYLVRWNDLESPAALYEILQKGIKAKVATKKFEMRVAGNTMSYDPGTILIPVSMQSLSSERIFAVLQQVSNKYRVRIEPVTTGGVVSGTDLGSNNFVSVTKPTIAMLVGSGVSALDAGEVWHLLDQRMNIPATHLEIATFNRVDLSKYNTIIMVGGSYSGLSASKLKSWVEGGGTLVLTEDAVTWAARNEISKVSFKKSSSDDDGKNFLPYDQRSQMDGAQQVRGAIFEVEIDRTHPLAFGYDKDRISLFKSNRIFMEPSSSPYATPFRFVDKPLQSGWVSKQNLEKISNSAAVVVSSIGSGRVINISENPNFRAIWLGGTKLFMNAVFFGRNVR